MWEEKHPFLTIVNPHPLIPVRQITSKPFHGLYRHTRSRSLRNRIPCSILSKAFDKSNRTNAVTCFRSIASRIISDMEIWSVSVECFFLFPFWCSVKQFWRVVYSVNWLKAARSQILDRAGSSDTGRLLLATSWSPSFNIGITTDSFQADGKTDVKRDLFISSVRTGSITGRASLITLMCNLSIPGALFEGRDVYGGQA